MMVVGGVVVVGGGYRGVQRGAIQGWYNTRVVPHLTATTTTATPILTTTTTTTRTDHTIQSANRSTGSSR